MQPEILNSIAFFAPIQDRQLYRPVDNCVVFFAVRLLGHRLGRIVLVAGQVHVRQLAQGVQAAQQVQRGLAVRHEATLRTKETQ